MNAQVTDLSVHHEPVSDLFKQPSAPGEWEQYRLSDEQVTFFNEFGYLPNIKLLNEPQIDRLNKELADITDPDHPGNSLFYEFHSNESSDPNAVLFHALGAWRVTGGFHDVLWNPAFVMAASQLLGGQEVRFWRDQLFCKRSEEHTSELQSLMRISYAVFCVKKKKHI